MRSDYIKIGECNAKILVLVSDSITRPSTLYKFLLILF